MQMALYAESYTMPARLARFAIGWGISRQARGRPHAWRPTPEPALLAAPRRIGALDRTTARASARMAVHARRRCLPKRGIATNGLLRGVSGARRIRGLQRIRASGETGVFRIRGLQRFPRPQGPRFVAIFAFGERKSLQNRNSEGGRCDRGSAGLEFGRRAKVVAKPEFGKRSMRPGFRRRLALAPPHRDREPRPVITAPGRACGRMKRPSSYLRGTAPMA